MNLKTIPLKFGAPGQNDPLLAGTVIFSIAAITLLYFIFGQEEMETSRITYVLVIVLVALAVVSLFWPQRPWPH